ncbi:MAG: hypothetical protein H5T41_07565 [Methanomassiliicoccales archaeon]|nr:hypothetical protein [Methanomassiliicoccales archaeon]
MTTVEFVMRKLCSGIEEFEATPKEKLEVDLEVLESRLKNIGVKEITNLGCLLLVLFEDTGTVCHVYSNGKILIKANMRNDAEKACKLIYELIDSQRASSFLD